MRAGPGGRPGCRCWTALGDSLGCPGPRLPRWRFLQAGISRAPTSPDSAVFMGWLERTGKPLPWCLACRSARIACYLRTNPWSAPWGSPPPPLQQGRLWRSQLRSSNPAASQAKPTGPAPKEPPSGGLTPLESVPWLGTSTLSPQPGCSLRWAVGRATHRSLRDWSPRLAASESGRGLGWGQLKPSQAEIQRPPLALQGNGSVLVVTRPLSPAAVYRPPGSKIAAQCLWPWHWPPLSGWLSLGSEA